MKFAVLTLMLGMAAAVLHGQLPIVIYSNTNPGGSLAGSICRVNEFGNGADPFAQGSVPTFGSETFTVPNDLVAVDENGTKSVLWWETNLKKLTKAADANGNGVLDPVEFQTVWSGSLLAGSNITATSVTAAGSKILFSNSTGNAQRGLIVLDDVNQDGDYLDAGEFAEVLNGGTGGAGATRTVNGMPIKTDQIDSAFIFPDGQSAVFKDKVGQVWYKLDLLTNDIQLFLNFNNTLSAEAAALPLGGGFAGLALPGTNSLGGLNVIDASFDEAEGVFFFCVENSSGDTRIFRGKDLNGDCDLNDAGEIGVFIQGNFGFGTTVTLEDLAVAKDFANFNPGPAPALSPASDGVAAPSPDEIFVIIENGTTGANATSVLRCVDLNLDGDADDVGEVQTMATLPSSQDPEVGGMIVLPPNTLASGCVRFGAVNTVVRSIGGSMRFSLRDIPAQHIGMGDFGIVVLSQAAPGNTSIVPGCNIGLVPDALTTTLLALNPYPFTFGPITSPFAVTDLVPYAAGLPVGFVIPFAAAIFGPGGLSVSNTSQIVVAP